MSVMASRSVDPAGVDLGPQLGDGQQPGRAVPVGHVRPSQVAGPDSGSAAGGAAGASSMMPSPSSNSIVRTGPV
jgi:hypothetical protein